MTKRPNGRSSNESEPVETPQKSGSDTDRDAPAGPNGNATGRDLVRSALAAARAKADSRGTEPGRRKIQLGGQNPRRRRWSGPGADARDPQPLGRLVGRMVAERGWQERVTSSRVFGEWARLVGEDVAEHAQPVTLKDGELTVRADSTAWATQLRLLQGQLIAKIAAGVGHGVVKRMRIHGPTAPSWRKGPRHVPGRGPRDTYG
ncbi:putative nucleic acid-binding Zn ribbon protein [Amycolatopsis endophytica]|uniref:UPF0232 protein HNR02_001765 n=1 Tax=Amycolatopsis endophytica TaxID=860233 RepID=A0A853B0L7_9PSEU|nr:putative nucleic acid-binding Zn ribbon protein [Amycolatopsis endophytica]